MSTTASQFFATRTTTTTSSSSPQQQQRTPEYVHLHITITKKVEANNSWATRVVPSYIDVVSAQLIAKPTTNDIMLASTSPTTSSSSQGSSCAQHPAAPEEATTTPTSSVVTDAQLAEPASLNPSATPFEAPDAPPEQQQKLQQPTLSSTPTTEKHSSESPMYFLPTSTGSMLGANSPAAADTTDTATSSMPRGGEGGGDISSNSKDAAAAEAGAAQRSYRHAVAPAAAADDSLFSSSTAATIPTSRLHGGDDQKQQQQSHQHNHHHHHRNHHHHHPSQHQHASTQAAAAAAAANATTSTTTSWQLQQREIDHHRTSTLPRPTTNTVQLATTYASPDSSQNHPVLLCAHNSLQERQLPIPLRVLRNQQRYACIMDEAPQMPEYSVMRPGDEGILYEQSFYLPISTLGNGNGVDFTGREKSNSKPAELFTMGSLPPSATYEDPQLTKVEGAGGDEAAAEMTPAVRIFMTHFAAGFVLGPRGRCYRALQNQLGVEITTKIDTTTWTVDGYREPHRCFVVTAKNGHRDSTSSSSVQQQQQEIDEMANAMYGGRTGESDRGGGGSSGGGVNDTARSYPSSFGGLGGASAPLHGLTCNDQINMAVMIIRKAVVRYRELCIGKVREPGDVHNTTTKSHTEQEQQQDESAYAKGRADGEEPSSDGGGEGGVVVVTESGENADAAAAAPAAAPAVVDEESSEDAKHSSATKEDVAAEVAASDADKNNDNSNNTNSNNAAIINTARMQMICGIPFEFKPPPKRKCPHAAKIAEDMLERRGTAQVTFNNKRGYGGKFDRRSRHSEMPIRQPYGKHHAGGSAGDLIERANSLGIGETTTSDYGGFPTKPFSPNLGSCEDLAPDGDATTQGYLQKNRDDGGLATFMRLGGRLGGSGGGSAVGSPSDWNAYGGGAMRRRGSSPGGMNGNYYSGGRSKGMNNNSRRPRANSSGGYFGGEYGGGGMSPMNSPLTSPIAPGMPYDMSSYYGYAASPEYIAAVMGASSPYGFFDPYGANAGYPAGSPTYAQPSPGVYGLTDPGAIAYGGYGYDGTYFGVPLPMGGEVASPPNAPFYPPPTAPAPSTQEEFDALSNPSCVDPVTSTAAM